MAGGVGDRTGGILSLCRLIERYGEAIEYDLLDRRGWSLDDVGRVYSWRDLWVLVMRWQKTPDTATCEAVQGVVHWSVTDQLLAGVFDILQFANWQRASKKHSPKPKPLQRPWDKGNVRKLGSKPIPISAFNDWWDSKVRSRRGRRHRARDGMVPAGSDS